MLSDADQRRLLSLARHALEARVRGDPAPAQVRGGALDLHCGAFVSLHRHGELRGCLGRIEADATLADTVRDLAAIVCDSDPRFAPVRLEELPDIAIEISVLTPEREVASVADIEIGRHGLIVEMGSHRGLLLPQVPVECGWDRDTFLDHTCLKAGLSRNGWRNGAKIWVFEAEVFGEALGVRRLL